MVYADDIVIYKPITTDLDLTALQNDIVSVDSWAKANSLKLTVMKTKAVTFSRKRHTPTFCLSLNGSSIPIVTSLKFLGVTLSNNLSWSEHINNICLRSKRQLGLIHRHFHAAPRVARERLYVSTVLPYLDYCSSVWDPHHLKNIAKLNSVQAFASKVVLQNWSVSRNDHLSTLNWVSLRKCRQIQKLVMCHKIVRNTSLLPSSYFSSLPSVSLPLCHFHNMRLYAPSVKTDYYKHSFFPSVISLWNSLPSSAQFSVSSSSFRHFLTNNLNINA